MNRAALLMSFLLMISALACTRHSTLRGSYSPSQDGKTYLAITDDNGGHCGPILMDGKVWPHRIGEIAPIEPGRHKISCGGDIDFEIPRGVVFKFDYWGP